MNKSQEILSRALHRMYKAKMNDKKRRDLVEALATKMYDNELTFFFCKDDSNKVIVGFATKKSLNIH